MKVIIEFDYFEEKEELENALAGGRHAAMIHNLDDWLRGLEKYQDQETIKVSDVRQKICDLYDGYGIDPWRT